MKRIIKRISVCFIVIMMITLISVPAFAETADAGVPEDKAAVTETVSDSGVLSAKAIAAAIAIAFAATGGAIAMGMAIAKSADGISRQPEAEGKIRTTLMLGLVFIETAVIYALIVAILIIFVL